MKRFRYSKLRNGSWLLIMVAAMLVLGACNGSMQGDDTAEEGPVPVQAVDEFADAEFESDGVAIETMEAAVEDQAGPQLAGFTVPFATGLRVIRDGRVDVRIEAGAFGDTATRVRTIAEDLGGYISAGETHLETIDETDYTVGWFTMRVPEERFEEALAMVDGLGERLDLEVSSQDVSAEYVDLEGRLRSWRNQEAFYARLMDEATTIDELVTIQTRLQDVLLNIEQIEGRLRYLDSRTEYSTLTVGLTELPGAGPVVATQSDPGIIEIAFDRAGIVLLGTVGFLIVAAAFLLPIAIMSLAGFVVFRAIQATRRRPTSTEG